MTTPDVVAAVLLAGATLYAVFGGADFGAGFWQLLSGRARDPEAVRARISHSLGPVWEANHVWLIFVLVVAWTGFSPAFADVMESLYIPLALAALGIVLRGSGFAFSKVIEGPARTRAAMVFAVSSILTPFFLGVVVGAIASGAVAGSGSEDALAWIGWLELVTGCLFVATGAYLAAAFLVHDSTAAGEQENASFFARCALGAAIAAGALAVVGVFALDREAHFVYEGLTGPGLPLVILSAVCGTVALALLIRGVRAGFRRRDLFLLRPAAVGAVVAMVWGWGVAQHPYLIPESVTIEQAAAPDPTLNALLVVFAAAAVIVVPALLLLYTLSQKRMLE
jgi:cytochrome bd ubiquinol oxidase subunit II